MSKDKDKGLKRYAGYIVGAIIVVLILSGIIVAFGMAYSWTNYGASTAMIVVDSSNGQISEPRLGPNSGFLVDGFKSFIGTQQRILIYYGTDSYENTVLCFSKDQLEMGITVLIRWQLNVSELKNLYKSFPFMNYKQTAIASIMEETLRFVTKNYTVLETIAYRQVVASDMQTEIFTKLRASPSLCNALTNLEFDLKNIAYPAEYTKAIETRLIVEQQKLQAEDERARILILANATAQEQIIKASGTAQSKVIEALGNQESINVLLNTTSPDLTKLYMYLQMMKDSNIPFVIIGSGENGVPVILDIPTNSTSTP